MSGWHILRTLLLVMEKLLEDEETQVGVVCGHVFIDMTLHWYMLASIISGCGLFITGKRSKVNY